MIVKYLAGQNHWKKKKKKKFSSKIDTFLGPNKSAYLCAYNFTHIIWVIFSVAEGQTKWIRHMVFSRGHTIKLWHPRQPKAQEEGKIE